MIWCVEDDASIRDIEVYTLSSTGFDARGFADGVSFWSALQTEKPDLVVLDVMLPGVDGIELLQRMKASAELRTIPVVMATAKGAEYDKIRGLDLGADYYLVKPFGVMELVSCVKAVLRRCQPEKLHISCAAAGSSSISTHTRSRSTARVSRLRIKNLSSCACFCPIRAWRSRATSSFRRSGAWTTAARPARSTCTSGRSGRSSAPTDDGSKRCAMLATAWRQRHDQKIFQSILLVAGCVLLASLLIIMGFLYDYFGGVEENQLRDELSLAAAAVEDGGTDYLSRLTADRYRLTWIAADGSVL